MTSLELQMPSQKNSDHELPEDESDADDNLDYYGDDQFELAMYSDTNNCADEIASSSSSMDCFTSIDPEFLEHTCLRLIDVEKMLNESVETLCRAIPITPPLAKMLLHGYKWDLFQLVQRYSENSTLLMIEARINPVKNPPIDSARQHILCTVCVRSNLASSDLQGLSCAHQFCRNCWVAHSESQLRQGVATGIECMEPSCRLLCPEDFILKLLVDRVDLRTKYQRFIFKDYVKSHPELRICPGTDCTTVIRAKYSLAKRAICLTCNHRFCFRCGNDYHAPTDCDTIKQWLIKCADDSETANYISANTKDCPECHACIEKNGGCNHMQCAKCKHHFCWMCFGDWKTHGSEYYECSRYKENPTVVLEAVHMKAKRALEKYLHYFERVPSSKGY